MPHPNRKWQKVPTKYFKNLLIQRSKIAKNASSKINAATQVLTEHYEPGQRWLIYCDSLSNLKMFMIPFPIKE